MSDEDWKRAKAIISGNMLMQARKSLLLVFKERIDPTPESVPEDLHIIVYAGNYWRIDRVEIRGSVPKWATRGWYLDNVDEKSNSNLTLEELVYEWQKFGAKNKTSYDGEPPGWDVGLYGVFKINDSILSMLVFGRHKA